MKIHIKPIWSALAFLVIIVFLTSSCQTQTEPEAVQSVEQWDVFEINLKGPSEGNPYMDNSLSATFSNGTNTVNIPGFYDGDGNYIIRFSPDQQGDWTYVTESNQTELSGKQGSLKCIAPSGSNHGPVEIVNTFYLQYADGTPFYSVGTTAYQWTSVKQSIQDKTIETLAEAPFNKIRMCVFPKRYRHGNDTEPWVLAYKRKDTLNDPSQPNFEFFRNFDKRVKQLLDMGIQADVILFHPYDDWGYYLMGDEMNEKYVRYMMARIGAYRNVWWSLANEWDIPRIKDTVNWEGIGTLLQNEDPYQRLRGIHNWHQDASHFYDHTRPWITHVSTQTFFFFNAIKWRNQYEKPVMFDEMRYEGDVPSVWGRLTSEEMSSYFWQAGLSGVYGTHGDTYKNDSDTETEVRWWAKGGTLPGNSPDRIAFFRKIMEEAPVTEMEPYITSISGLAIPDTLPHRGEEDLIAQLIRNVYTFAKEGEYYLTYTADSAQAVEVNLEGDKNYTMEVIDTWNMEIDKMEDVSPGKFQFVTEKPYTALRFIAKD